MSDHGSTWTPDADLVAEAVDIHGPVDVTLLQDAIRQVTGEAEAVRLRAGGGHGANGTDGRAEFTDGGSVPLTMVDLADEPDPAAALDAWLRGRRRRAGTPHAPRRP